LAEKTAHRADVTDKKCQGSELSTAFLKMGYKGCCCVFRLERHFVALV
jgi:hypothetical protein